MKEDGLPIKYQNTPDGHLEIINELLTDEQVKRTKDREEGFNLGVEDEKRSQNISIEAEEIRSLLKERKQFGDITIYPTAILDETKLGYVFNISVECKGVTVAVDRFFKIKTFADLKRALVIAEGVMADIGSHKLAFSKSTRITIEKLDEQPAKTVAACIRSKLE